MIRKKYTLIYSAIIFAITKIISLSLVIMPQHISIWWPPAGVLLATILITEKKDWYKVILTIVPIDILIDTFQDRELIQSIVFSFANFSEAFIAGVLITKFAKGKKFLTSTKTYSIFLLSSCIIAPSISSLIGAYGAYYLGKAPSFFSIYRLWWISAGLGIAYIVPPLVLLESKLFTSKNIIKKEINYFSLVEAITPILIISTLSMLIFIGPDWLMFRPLYISFIIFPLLIFISVKHELRGVTVSSLTFAVSAIFLVSKSEVSDIISKVNEVYILQSYLIVIIVSSYILAIFSRNIREKLLNIERQKQIADCANQSRSNFLARLDHEIKTPVGILLSFSELLKTNKTSDIRQQSNIILRATNNLLLTIGKLIDLSKLEANQLIENKTVFNFPDLIKEVTESLIEKANSTSITLDLKKPHMDTPIVKGDRKIIGQIIFELIDNAIKFSNKNGNVTITTELETDNLAVTVKDRGIGINKKDHDIIFQSFTQNEKFIGRTKEGIGVGLTLVSKLIKIINGKILIDSEVEKGTTFTVKLPLNYLPPINNLQSEINNKISILHIDDSEDILAVIDIFLSDCHNIDSSLSGIDGLNMFKSKKYDLVILDIQMPVMNGFELASKIRKWEVENNKIKTPILALSAHALREDIEQAKSVGCNMYMSKPVTKKQLLDIIISMT